MNPALVVKDDVQKMLDYLIENPHVVFYRDEHPDTALFFIAVVLMKDALEMLQEENEQYKGMSIEVDKKSQMFYILRPNMARCSPLP